MILITLLYYCWMCKCGFVQCVNLNGDDMSSQLQHLSTAHKWPNNVLVMQERVIKIRCNSLSQLKIWITVWRINTLGTHIPFSAEFHGFLPFPTYSTIPPSICS